jgi:crossover junction endodeoxyribonuclease RuvC
MGVPLIILGIDPGVSGGIAAIDECGRVYLAARMPATERDLLDLLRGTAVAGGRLVEQRRAVLEFVRASPQMGVVSAFTFGRNYGALRMALIAAGIPFDELSPAKWQPGVGLAYPKDATQVLRKNLSKRRAQELFPDATVTHAIADALLLAEHGRRTTRRSALGEPLSPGGPIDGEKENGVPARVEGNPLVAAVEEVERAIDEADERQAELRRRPFASHRPRGRTRRH